MAVSPSRSAAFDVLLRVERDAAFATDLLHSKRLDALSTADRGLATEIVLGVLRWQSVLDHLLGGQSSQPLRKLDIEVLIALRIAAYQLRFLDRIPANAAVNESVELVKRARKRSAVPFANAVLRKLANLAKLPDERQTLAEKYAHPAWLVERWIKNYGAEAAEAICRYDQQVPVTAIRLPVDPVRREIVERELTGGGISLAPGLLLTSARRVLSGDVRLTQAFARGEAWIQDEASQFVALLAGQGDRILDCCAAPGGKTAVLAERNPSAKVVAVELHEQRARLLRERVKAANVEVQTCDVTALSSSAAFDCVLADVPCSGTGTLAHNPEIKWRLRPEHFVDLQQRQIAILKAAIQQLAPGGRLVYSTCSLEPEEGELVIEAVLSEDVQLLDCVTELDKLRPEIASPDQPLIRGKYLRTLPGIHLCDGFFAAVVRKRTS
jgi:16S rRNA (cytosine967-C5)-methyltransferase